MLPFAVHNGFESGKVCLMTWPSARGLIDNRPEESMKRPPTAIRLLRIPTLLLLALAVGYWSGFRSGAGDPASDQAGSASGDDSVPAPFFSRSRKYPQVLPNLTR